MKHYIPLLLLLAFLGACAPKVDDGIAIPGVTPADVYHKYPDRGMFMYRKEDSAACRTILTMSSGGIDYDIKIFGRNASVVDSVWVGLKANPKRADALRSQQFFRVVAATPYDGSNPDWIEGWLTDHFNDREARTSVGPVEYVLRASSKHQREMTMRRRY
jgi:hypothetical protein